MAEGSDQVERTLVRTVMSPDSNVVHEDESVLVASRLMLRTGITAIPIVDDDRHFKGVIGYREIVTALAIEGDGADTQVGEIEAQWVSIDPGATVEEAVRLIGQTGIQPLPVLEDSVLVGALSHLDILGHARLRELGLDASNVVKTISPHDGMAVKQLGGYFLAGASAVNCIRTAMSAVQKDGVAKILDLGSGYGRVLRLLRVVFEDAYLAACDLDPEAVDFCAETFGATPIYSNEDPSKVENDEKFDLIWSGSLFTHLDMDPWLGFFDLAARSLTADGLFVFTTSGRRDRREWNVMGLGQPQIDKVLEGYDRDGFGFAPYSDDVNYGLSAVSPEWVGAQIERRSGLRLVMHTEGGWEPPAPLQDVYVVSAAT